MGKKSLINNILKNILFNFVSILDWDRKIIASQLAEVVSTLLMTYMGIIIPVEIVVCVEKHFEEPTFFFQSIGIKLFIYIACNIIRLESSQYTYRNSGMLAMYYSQKVYSKITKMPYEKLEEKDFHDSVSQIWNVLKQDYIIRNYIVASSKTIIAIIGVIWYGAIIIHVNFLFIIFNLLFGILGFSLLSIIKNKQDAFYGKLDLLSRITSYISKIAMDSSAGKDIRIFGMKKKLSEKYDVTLDATESIYNKMESMYVKEELSREGVSIILTAASYLYFGIRVFEGNMHISEFVFYISILNKFSVFLIEFLNSIQISIRSNISIDRLRRFIEIPENTENKVQITSNKLSLNYKIEFRNVTYKYPNADEPALKKINFTINSCKKIGLIGLNGAGKTTLIKLICGLYKPTEGDIIINGYNTKDIKDMSDIVSALFQDSDVLPVSVDGNITGREDVYSLSYKARQRIEKVIHDAGFDVKYRSLLKQGKTKLVKRVNEDATDLSGGEKQKLLFARALFDEARILILDEPTAALDPIAEKNLYHKFSELGPEVTSIFTSHRLSSTTFCDEIILLDNGEIIEYGTHKELMNKKGKYASLFSIQSKYYRMEREEQNDEGRLA